MRHVEQETTFVGISELRTRADEILNVARRGRVVVEKRHKPMVVLVPIEQYDRTQEVLEAIEDYVLGMLAKERERHSPRKSYLSLEELERRVGLRHR